MIKLHNYALLEELAESARIENDHPWSKRCSEFPAETRRGLITAMYGGVVKRSWVRRRAEKPIRRVGEANERGWVLAKRRAVSKTCRKIVLISTKTGGKS